MTDIRNLRRLTQGEIDTLTEALELLVDTTGIRKGTKWSAQAMLDQRMSENFFWAN